MQSNDVGSVFEMNIHFIDGPVNMVSSKSESDVSIARITSFSL
jgi:hypothetical protein